MRVVQTLLRSGADPLMGDSVGCTPSQVTTNDEIRALLTKAERKQKKLSSWRDSELPDNLDDDADIDANKEAMLGHLVRINSKNVYVVALQLEKIISKSPRKNGIKYLFWYHKFQSPSSHNDCQGRQDARGEAEGRECESGTGSQSRQQLRHTGSRRY